MTLAGLLLFTLPAQAQNIRLKSSEGYITTDDQVRLFYRVTGEGGDTVLVVHGGPYNFRYLSADLSPLAAHHTFIYYDQRGSGFSSFVGDTTKLHVRKHLEDIETIRRHFKLGKLNLMGHSSGGLISGHYAATHPEHVKSIQLVNPATLAPWPQDNSARTDSITKLLNRQNREKFYNSPADFRKSCWDYYALVARFYYPTPVHARRTWGDVCHSLQENMMNPARGYANETMNKINIIPQLAGVKAPVLVLAGDNDFMPYASFEQWKNSFPNSALVRFKGAGHSPHVDDPDLFFTATETFLQGKFPDAAFNPPKSAGVILPGDDNGTPYQQARSAVIRAENELVRLVNKGDWEGAAAVYSADGVIYAPGAPPISGRQAIASFWHTVSIRGMHSVELQLMDLEISGDLLNARGKYVMRNRQKEYIDIGKFVAIYKRENNKWVLHTDIFNSSLETRSPIEEPDYLKFDDN